MTLQTLPCHCCGRGRWPGPDEVCLDQIDVAVEVKVSDADSHASQRLARPAERNAAQQGLLAKRAVMIVHQQQARRGVAGDEDVWPSVFVDVTGDRSEAVGIV